MTLMTAQLRTTTTPAARLGALSNKHTDTRNVALKMAFTGTNKSSSTIYYVCPCTDISKRSSLLPAEEQSLGHQPPAEEEEEAIPFNPHDPRANFAQYPIEHLLFCTECHELRCPRCSYEESLSAFCPSCLQERSSNSTKTESNR